MGRQFPALQHSSPPRAPQHPNPEGNTGTSPNTILKPSSHHRSLAPQQGKSSINQSSLFGQGLPVLGSTAPGKGVSWGQGKEKEPGKAGPGEAGLGGLIPAGLGMIGVPGGPPPPGGPCGETERGSDTQPRASPTSPHSQTQWDLTPPNPACPHYGSNAPPQLQELPEP